MSTWPIKKKKPLTSQVVKEMQMKTTSNGAPGKHTGLLLAGPCVQALHGRGAYLKKQ